MITIINPKKVKYISCPDCNNLIRAEFNEKKNKRWVVVRQCGNCGFKKLLLQEDVDTIQPSSQLWDLVYDDNSFEATELRKKFLEQQNERRKENLERQYDRQFSKPWERKYVKDKVLNKENSYGL